jgi:hypothetical protein
MANHRASLSALTLILWFLIMEMSFGQVFEMNCEVRTLEGQLVAKLPLFRPILVFNELQIPHPIGSDLWQPLALKGRLVLVSYGITTQDGTWDDYRGAEIKGKIAVVFSGVPANDTVRFRPADLTAGRKIDNAAKHGAAGVVFIGNPIRERADDPNRSSLLRLMTKPQASIPAIVLGTAQLEHILFRTFDQPIRDWTSPNSIPEAVARVSEDEGRPFGPLDLGLTLEARINHDPLRKIESEHYITYYFYNASTEARIRGIVQAHEEAYRTVTKDLGVEADRKLVYISFPQWKMKWILTGHIGYGWAPRVFIMEVDDGTNFIDPYHETCHILLDKLNPQYAGALSEGFATHWGGWQGQDVHDLTRANMARLTKSLCPFSVLLGDTTYDHQQEKCRGWGYEESGSICRYVIDTYGMLKFLDFWKLLRTGDFAANAAALKKVCGMTPEEIEKGWRKFILR